jgi:hypothetical protein
MTERRKRMSHARWIEHLETQEASGVSVAEYCQSQNLAVASFMFHRLCPVLRKSGWESAAAFGSLRQAGPGHWNWIGISMR